MEENKILETVETVADQVNEEAVDQAAEAGKAVIDAAKKMDIWSVIFIIALVIGMIFTGAWIVVGIIFLVKKIKAKKAENVEPKNNDVFVETEAPAEETVTE